MTSTVKLLDALADAAVRAAEAGHGATASRLTNAYIRLRIHLQPKGKKT